MKLAIHHNLDPQFRMSGNTLSHCHMPSWQAQA